MMTTLARVLNNGSRGTDVADVQKALNQLPSGLAQLVPDGIYGNKTASRVKEFQGQNRLSKDGIFGPLSFAMLLKLLGGLVGTPPRGPPDTRSAIRDATIREAAKLVGRVDFSLLANGRPKGIDLVQDIFREAAGVTLTDAHFKDPVTKAWSPQPFVGGQKKNWCGIFCVYCYRKAGLKSITWNLRIGAPSGPIRLNTWSPQFVQNIKLADMGAVATRQHHFLIEKVGPTNPHTPSLDTIDGNLLAGRIERRKGHHRVGKDNFNYYSLT